MPRAHGLSEPSSTSSVSRKTLRPTSPRLMSNLQEEFDKKLRPVVAEIAGEEHIGIIFEIPHQTIVWASPSIDVTSKVIERLEAASKPKP
jgi:hypothetical protein